jgi:hypothetical protein
MAGTFVVALMAWHVYGPPIEQLRPLLLRAKEAVSDLWNSSRTTQLLAEIPPPAAFDPPGPGLAPLEGATRYVDSQVAPAAGWSDPPPLSQPGTAASATISVGDPAAIDPTGAQGSVASAIEGLRSRGVADYSMSQWGTSSGLYRFRCSAPSGTGGMFQRHFEAVSADPAEAARRVLADVEAWQASHTGQAATQLR